LKKPEAVATYRELVKGADAVIEGMRPGALKRLGLGFEELQKINPRIVLCTHSGYGMTGPYKDMPSHGIAYDAWAGVARPSYTPDGLPTIPSYTAIGINAGPLYAALGICAAIIRARATGKGCYFEVAQCDAAAAFNWNGIEGNKAYERPEDEVTGNDGDGKGERRPVGDDSMKESVRYQYYRSKDGLILFMASEREFWKNFCEGVDRADLFAANPGAKYADHARGNMALRRVLAEIFASRTTVEWVEFGQRVNTPICPVNTVKTIPQDPQFQARLTMRPFTEAGTDLMPSPIRTIGEELPVPAIAARAPGRDTEEVLRDVLGYDDARIAALKASGAIG
ncbi:MAG TPA: CaiB/BaiF CoA-transferase family protein, partial [Candidatus Binatia bacterium]|nr:CaiB/BaiF CoA-transferase family protein [Candidatus Binatia bacterium]